MTNLATDLIDRLAGSAETTLLVPLLRLLADGDPVRPCCYIHWSAAARLSPAAYEVAVLS